MEASWVRCAPATLQALSQHELEQAVKRGRPRGLHDAQGAVGRDTHSRDGHLLPAGRGQAWHGTHHTEQKQTQAAR